MRDAIMVTESTSRQASTLRPAILPAILTGWLARLSAGAALLVLSLLTASSQPARADSPPLGIFIYAIIRDGQPIGQQRMEFVNDGEKLRVLSHTELDVTLLGMNLYGFNQSVEEVHSGGRMQSMTSEADDDGKDRKVSLTLQGDVLKGDYNGDQRIVDPKLPTSLFWQKPALGDVQIVDTLRGKVRDVTVKDLGTETLSLPVGKVETHHYQMTGEWKRDLWYDANGVLVAGELVKDGATIRQELQQRP
jgi:hypothetical protein